MCVCVCVCACVPSRWSEEDLSSPASRSPANSPTSRTPPTEPLFAPFVLKIDNSLRQALPGNTLAHFESVLYRFLTELLAKRLKRSPRQTFHGEHAPLVYER